jgi:hypothetical protein
MAKLHKLHSKITFSGRVSKKVLGDKTYDEIHPIGTAAVEAAKPPPPPPAAIPMPDEEDINRARRRSRTSQGQRTGRASTILSDSDRLGP